MSSIIIRNDMSQVTLNQFTVNGDQESGQKKVSFENPLAKNFATKLTTRSSIKSSDTIENRSKICKPNSRPSTVPKTNGQNISKLNEESKFIWTPFESFFPPDLTGIHKLGTLPAYLRKKTKESVESEFFNKCKRFKADTRELLCRQANIKKDYEHLKSLKEKFKAFGGRDLKLATLELIQITGEENNCSIGDGLKIGTDKDVDDQLSNLVPEKYNKFDAFLISDIEQEIRNIREADEAFRHKVIESNAAILNQLNESGNKALQQSSYEILTKIEDDWKTLNNVKETSIDLLLENLVQLKSPFVREETSESNYSSVTIDRGTEVEILKMHDDLKRRYADLEMQNKLMQSEIDAREQRLEQLTSEYNTREENLNDMVAALRTEILNKERTINEYLVKFDQYVKRQTNYEVKIKKLEERSENFNNEMKENIHKYETQLSEKEYRCVELERKLEDLRRDNINHNQVRDGSSNQILSTQLATATEDLQELQYKIVKREKQIHTMKQIITHERNKLREFDELQQKYEALRHQESCKAQEMQQLKEMLNSKSNTINGHLETIAELKNLLLGSQSTVYDTADEKEVSNTLDNENILKLTKQERIIEKLENNKIRSNALRDQLLERISILEKENEDAKAQIRKFHEDFTINRFMYDEQRRKKRLTEILVKQIQK